MTATLIDGKQVAKDIKAELKQKVAVLRDKGVVPGLAAVLIGDDPASATYVKSKARACDKLGVFSEIIRRPADTTQNEVETIVRELNDRDDIDGILVQSPLPKHLDEFAVTLLIDPSKDVDGFHPHSVGRLLIGKPSFRSCTPYGIIELMRRYHIDPSGKEVVVLGRSNIVGKPMAAMLMQKSEMANATVTVAHSRTADVAGVCLRAAILIAAIGQPLFVKANMVKSGVVIIDVGMNRIDDPSSEKGYRLVGDVDFDTCVEKASYITPVPGGVGPMTIAMLLTNTVQSASRRAGLE